MHDFLVGFFEGFPEYKDRDFWITGESYGGTYIPLIMDTIDQMGVITTLKGAAIGNGCTEGSCFSGWRSSSPSLLLWRSLSGLLWVPPSLQKLLRPTRRPLGAS